MQHTSNPISISTSTLTQTSFLSDLTSLLQKYSLDNTTLNPPNTLTQTDEKSVHSCINILNKIIKKRRSDTKGNKPDKTLRKAARVAELQAKKLAEKTFVSQQNPTLDEIPDRIKCYVCRGPIQTGHFFYDSMCPTCGDLNYSMRTKQRDLTGYTAIVTGGRVKIGYQIALWLLNNNCSVIVTTRYPADALQRFQKEPNYDTFKDRLFLYGLDFKNMSKVSQFINFIKTNYKEINILINNAAQTLYRSDDYNNQLVQDEDQALKAIQADPTTQPTCDSSFSLVKNTSTSLNNQLALFENAFPIYDINHIPVDFSAKNSWTKEIDEIDFREFAEAQVINSWVPFILCSNLKQIMTVPGKKSFIINVSAMEGKFDYPKKKSAHPHTNMAKAALNMLTRTCGINFKKSNIYMTSVDTGWCSEMVPSQMYAMDRTVPLDEIDGAMRVLQPIFDDLELHSVLLKDYKETTW